MKKISLAILPFLLLIMSACGPKEVAIPIEVEFSVNGMTCQNCVDGITSEVSKLPGVESCVVDLESASARVNFNPEKMTADQIQKRINKLGFEATLPLAQ